MSLAGKKGPDGRRCQKLPTDRPTPAVTVTCKAERNFTGKRGDDAECVRSDPLTVLLDGVDPRVVALVARGRRVAAPAPAAGLSRGRRRRRRGRRAAVGRGRRRGLLLLALGPARAADELGI